MAIDLSDEKLAVAKKLGATDCFKAEIARRGGGSARGDARRSAIRVRNGRFREGDASRLQRRRRGGTTVTAGLPPPHTRFRFPRCNSSPRNARSAAATSAPRSARDIPNFIALYQRGRLPVNRLLTGRLRLDEINLGFDRLSEGKAVRQVVMM